MFNKHLVGTFCARAVGAQSDLGKIQCHRVWEVPDMMSANVVGQLASSALTLVALRLHILPFVGRRRMRRIMRMCKGTRWLRLSE